MQTSATGYGYMTNLCVDGTIVSKKNQMDKEHENALYEYRNGWRPDV
jgi:hypothetical protein